jgi:hypothetical protein
VTTDKGMGSGMVVDKAGFVLTNSHVIEGSQTVTVMLSGGQKLPATILGRDEITDLAILKISGENLPTVILGDSDKLRQGEEVIAIGYPLDLAGSTTITKGIVSAFRNYEGVIYVQTDTAINPGNSGGALINLKGEVVGINVMSIRVAGGQTIEGMNFAIAINGAKPIIPKLMAGESILKPETWETYSNSAYGYSIQYPSTWTLTVNKTFAGQDVIDSPSSGRIVLNRYEALGRTVSHYVDTHIDVNSKALLTYQVLSRKDGYWHGIYPSCDWIDLHRSDESHPLLKSRSLYLECNGYFYGVTGLANESEYESYSSTIDKIIASFRLIE